MTSTSDATRNAINAAHRGMRAALDARKLDRYLSFLHPALTYTQTDGTTLGKQGIAQDVRRQFGNAHVIRTRFRRESFDLTPDGATEVLQQDIAFIVRAFGVVHREWTVARRGRYDWVQDAEGWQIKRVEVASEETSSRWYLASPGMFAT